ncbi:elongin A, like isoform X1 [Anguilla anguilla]|uniref:elongin A, like isoform X1 n=1 Tax=Anguilla anguilla TaxID=7936 RepID=UPI0015AFC080|nr:elongin A, like isoform X1 [Anguilla anguilla]
MAAADVLKKVLQLKRQLKESSNSKTILKTLKRLQELDVTLNILADTGIGKAVNAYRKHSDAGEVAKSLVNQWKQLVPKEPTSPVQEQSGDEEQCHKDQLEVSENKCFDDKKSGSTGSDTECKPGGSHRRSKVPFRQESRGDRSHLHLNNTPKKDKNKVSSPKSSLLPAVHPDVDSKFRGSRKRGVCEITNGQEAKRSQKDKKSSRAKETPPERKKKEEPSDEEKGQNGEVKNLDTEEKATKKTKKGGECTNESQPSGDEMGKPTMSFESYLSYDLKAPKRKKKPCDSQKTPKKFKVAAVGEEPQRRASCGKSITEQPKRSLEESPKKPSTGSVMDLLNIPLPTFLPECEDFTTFPYFEKKSEDEASAVSEEAPVFTGQRLNRKMQVYSGTKTSFLPTMMSLHQQCIRTLQNNIDLLYEIGGVPFDILEPVLERCTPEQLLRIEECNPVYIGDTDHLWERHCQRDFRNGCLEEYESWREMHLRLSKEREKKLQKLTESIVSAYSGKPKGRQVKLAFINSTVKPPRNVRIKQEVRGTAGPVMSSSLPDRPRPAQALDRTSGKALDSRARPGCSDAMASTSQAPDPRKIKRLAPMMAKSLKAFKKQLVRR